MLKSAGNAGVADMNRVVQDCFEGRSIRPKSKALGGGFGVGRITAANLERAFAEAGRDEDVTVKIFPEAGHSLATDGGERMAPGVFGTLRSWLATRGFAGRASDRR